MLIGPNAPIVIEGVRSSHFENVWDFYKPSLHSEYPTVDGALSISCYFRSLDGCYSGFKRKFNVSHRHPFDLTKHAQYALFHSPFTKLVRKSYARLFQNDWLLEGQLHGLQPRVKEEWRQLTLEQTYNHNELQKAFMEGTETIYDERVTPSLLLSKHLGNSYTGSLYASLCSLISEKRDDLLHKRALMFSYGSGSAATMFSVRFDGPVGHIASKLDIPNRLKNRRMVDAAEYTATMKLREDSHSLANYTPTQPIDDLFPGTYYLKHIDAAKKRTYGHKH